MLSYRCTVVPLYRSVSSLVEAAISLPTLIVNALKFILTAIEINFKGQKEYDEHTEAYIESHVNMCVKSDCNSLEKLKKKRYLGGEEKKVTPLWVEK